MPDVRFGPLADICSAKGHVRFAPNSDRESGFPQTVMSALPLKADMWAATRDVRYGPIADVRDVDVAAGPTERFFLRGTAVAGRSIPLIDPEGRVHENWLPTRRH
jgi:hypothetical protein